MLTYQLRERIFQFPSGTQPEFPNNVIIEIKLAPEVPFGGVQGKSRNVITDQDLKVKFNFSTGRSFVERHGKSLFDPIEAKIDVHDTHFEIKGNKARVEAKCSNLQDLQDLLSALYYAFPAVLNLYFPDAPYPLLANGTIGDTPFKWIYEPSQVIANTVPTSKERQESYVTDSWKHITQFIGVKNRRLIGALHYFYVACRLLTAGSNQFEFMSESLLNFSRSLQSLFGETRDEVRTELKKLGKYSNDEIEAYFLTALILRNEFDVAHVNLSILKKKELRVLHDYSQEAETRIRKLLKLVLESIEKGEYIPPEDPKMVLSKDKIKILNTIRKNLLKILKK